MERETREFGVVAIVLRCIVFMAIAVPVVRTLIALSGPHARENPIGALLGFALYGVYGTLLASVVIAIAYFVTYRKMPKWLSSIGRASSYGLLLGLVVGLLGVAPDLLIIYARGNPWPGGTSAVIYDIGQRFLSHVLPYSICTTIFVLWITGRLRSNHLVQRTGRDRPAAD